MKRSRRSEYDRKKNRPEKHSERKFTNKESTEASGSTASDVPKSIAASSMEDTAPSTTSTTPVRPKSVVPIVNETRKSAYGEALEKKSSYSGLKIVLVIAVAIFSIVRLVYSLNKLDKPDSVAKQQKSLKKARRTLERSFSNSNSNVKVTDFIVGKNVPIREIMQLRKDSVFPIIDHVNVRLFERFHIFDATTYENTEILAKFSKYYFLYDRVDASPIVNMGDQWVTLRNAIANGAASNIISQEKTKEYNFKGMQIEEHDFKVLYGNGQLHGVATLIEHDGKRHFFQFVSKEKNGTYFRRSYLRRYLNYYLKIK
ncbi:MAG: hypothetical protein AAF617_04765 [Bacteroidota bacterium]